MTATASGHHLPPALTGVAALVFVVCLVVVGVVIFLVKRN
jgi:hypothetical protein